MMVATKTAAIEPPALALATLGPLAAARGGAAVEGFGYDKVRALLVYLAVEGGRPHRRASLAALLWPEQPDRSARGNLSQALSTLRRALGDRDAPRPIVHADADAVWLDPAVRVDVDAVRFLGLVGAADAHPHRSWRTCGRCAEQLRQAVGLYRGDFLGHFAIADSAPFEEWAQFRREHLLQRVLGALEHLVERAEWCGEHAAAAELARRQVALSPLEEHGHRALMRQMVLSGEPAAALAHYRALCRTLAGELAAEPEAETVALVERIRGGATADLRRFAPPPFHAPAPPTAFVGRAGDREAVCAALGHGAARALTLVGTGGVGKTRLALQVALDLRYDFEDGVFVVELEALSDARGVPAAIAHALGVKERPGEALSATLRARLSGRHLLLVLDGCEHLLGQNAARGRLGALAAELLAGCPALRVLATSRAPLRFRAEQLVPVAPLPEAEAAELFVARARGLAPGYAAAAEDAPLVAEICRRLDGLPLAIELIAPRAATGTPSALLRDLDRDLHALPAGPDDAPARHRTLHAAIAWSYDRLCPVERRAFAQLGVFAGGGTMAAVEAVVEDGANVRAAIEGLADANLVALRATGDGPRFAMLGTIRAFALAALADQGGVDAARRRHAAHFLALAERAGAEPRRQEDGDRLDLLECEHENLRAALGWYQAGDAEGALRIAAALGAFWVVRGYLEEGRRALSDALAACPEAPPALRLAALDEASALCWRQGDYAAARGYTEASLAVAYAVEDDRAVARSLRRLGAVAWDQGDSRAARSHYERSLAVAREHDDLPAIAGALNNLGMVAAGCGDDAGALVLYDACLPMFRQLREATNVGNVLMNLGLVAGHLGDAAAARARLEEGLATFRALGHRSGEALALLNLGNLDVTVGDLDAAAARFEESLALLRALGDEATGSYPRFGLGEVAFAKGDLVAARSQMVQSLVARCATGEQRPIPRNLEGIAGLERSEGRPASAARLLGAAAALREALGGVQTEQQRPGHAREVAALREALGDAALEVAWSEGRAMSVAEACALALGTSNL